MQSSKPVPSTVTTSPGCADPGVSAIRCRFVGPTTWTSANSCSSLSMQDTSSVAGPDGTSAGTGTVALTVPSASTVIGSPSGSAPMVARTLVQVNPAPPNVNVVPGT